MAEPSLPDAYLYDSRYNAVPQHHHPWIAAVPSPVVTHDLHGDGGMSGSASNSPGLPSSPGLPFPAAWGTGTSADPAPHGANPCETSTSASTPSGLISAEPTNAPTVPWTPTGHIVGGGYSPGSSTHLGASTQHPIIDGTPLQPTIPKAIVASTANRDASEQRRKAEQAFPCLFPGCGQSFTRKQNLTSK